MFSVDTFLLFVDIFSQTVSVEHINNHPKSEKMHKSSAALQIVQCFFPFIPASDNSENQSNLSCEP